MQRVRRYYLLTWEKNAFIAKSAEVLQFVNMGDDRHEAKSVDDLFFFVNMGDNALNAKNAKALLFVNTGDDALDVKSTERFYL